MSLSNGYCASESTVMGDSNVGAGKAVLLLLSKSKCLSKLEKCSTEQNQTISELELKKGDMGILKFYIFVNELYLDFESYSDPMKTRTKIIHGQVLNFLEDNEMF